MQKYIYYGLSFIPVIATFFVVFLPTDPHLFAYILPTIIFTCWHFALLCAKDVSYLGGALALVGGAGFMGVLWGLSMFKTRKIGVVIAAHILVNFFSFSQLIYENWFMAAAS